jgi:hypothetical protein
MSVTARAGSASIHSALSEGANHIVMACPRPEPDSKPGNIAIDALDLTQRPFYRNPKASPDVGLVNCTAFGFVPRPLSQVSFPDRLN